MVGTVATAIPPLLVVAARIGAEQHASGAQRRVQPLQHLRQLCARHMKQRGVGEYAVKAAGRQLQIQEILLPYFATARARHGHERRRALQSDGRVAEGREGAQIAPGPATEVEYRERRLAGDMPQQRRDVLADIVIEGTGAKLLRALRIVAQRSTRDGGELLGGQRLVIHGNVYNVA